MRVFLTSVGCKLNQSEIEAWGRRLAAAGCEIVAAPTAADWIVVNGCTVTSVAAFKSRQLVRRCHRTNPEARIAVTGCYAQIHPEEAARLPGTGLVLGSAAKDRLPEIIIEKLEPRTCAPRLSICPAPPRHTRAFVKIQDGCDNVCTYCIVRLARGRQRSRPVQDVLAEVLARQAEGYQEVVLTGVHIGAYGRDCGTTLEEVVRGILDRAQISRLRLSSIEPWDVSDGLLALWENQRLCRHLHLPLQSGCDSTLQRMKRRYTTKQYCDLVHRAREAIPDLAVTTDVIVGFPGEDEGEFAASAAFVGGMEFARIHVFPFSARPGTEAATMTGQVPPQVKEERVRHMLAIGRNSAQAFRRRFLDRAMDVLWESARGNAWSGLTDNYIRVQTISEQHLHNRILPARLRSLTAHGMRGELAA